MANKNKRSQIQQANQRRANQQRYEVESKKLTLFTLIALGVSVVLLLLLFVNFAGVYNPQAKNGIEVKVSGWSFAIAALTGNYSSDLEAVYGNLAVPFYYYAREFSETVAVFALLTVVVILFNVAVQVITVVKKMYILNCVSAILNVVIAALLIVCFAEALAMKYSDIIPDYCNGNPLCSIGSYAIVPAIFAIGSAAVSVYTTVRYMKVSKLLK